MEKRTVGKEAILLPNTNISEALGSAHSKKATSMSEQKKPQKRLFLPYNY